MKIKIKLSEGAKLPTYAHETDACFDLYAMSKTYDPANNIIEYDTGVAMEIPEDHVGLVFPRSSCYKTPHLLRNGVGVVDTGYRGNIIVKMLTVTNSPNQYEIGDRCAQMMIIPRPKIEFEVVEKLDDDSERGTCGYGSTGK